MGLEETAICYIHGHYYSGYAECPICKVYKEADREDKQKREDNQKKETIIKKIELNPNLGG